MQPQDTQQIPQPTPKETPQGTPSQVPQFNVAPAQTLQTQAAGTAAGPAQTEQQARSGSGNTAKPKQNPNSAQNSLLLSEIRDNMAIMNDGSMRTVVVCQSINFDLMSAKEREAVEYSYQNFLNSLYFPIQILCRSQKVDIGPYLDRLSKLRREQDNMLLGILMDDYIEFIAELAQETNIMDKSFFIVIPYYPSGDMTSAVNSSRSFLANLFAPSSQQRIRIDENTFNKAKEELKNRVQTVLNGLLQIGIKSTQLNTKQLGELYYNTYNPDTAVRQPIGDFNNLTSPVIAKGSGQAPQPHLDRGVN